jgi:hypothetical protein
MIKKLKMNNIDINEFNPTLAELQELVSTTKEIEVTDYTDKKQIKEVKENRLALRDARINITKKGKELRQDAIDFQKSVIEREKELVGIIEPEEGRLKEIEEKAKEEKAKAERIEILPQRKSKLETIGDDVKVKNDELLKMDDATFTEYYDKRVADKNEAERKKLEEKERKLQQKEEDMKREEEARKSEEKARHEERESAEKERKEESERVEREKKEEEERKKREEAEQKEEEKRKKKELEKEDRFQEWLKEKGWTEEKSDSFQM